MNTANEEQAAAAFRRAMALHQQGRLDQAAADYHRALQSIDLRKEGGANVRGYLFMGSVPA